MWILLVSCVRRFRPVVCPPACYWSLIKIIIRHPLVFYASWALNLAGSSGHKTKSTNDSRLFEKPGESGRMQLPAPQTRQPWRTQSESAEQRRVYCYLMVYMQSTVNFVSWLLKNKPRSPETSEEYQAARPVVVEL